MRITTILGSLAVSAGLVAGFSAAAAAAGGYVTLSASGSKVLTACNPKKLASDAACHVDSLPGIAGFSQVASRSTPLMFNEVRIGTVYEKVWRSAKDKTDYVFGVQVVVTPTQYDSSGLFFRVNDVFRQSLPDQAVAVSYYRGGAKTPLLNAGRTVQGLNEYDEAQPDRDNTWIDYRVDADANLKGVRFVQAPWVLSHMKAPKGYAINILGLRVLNSDTEDFLDAVDFYTSAYQPNGVPPPADDGDDD